MSDPQFVPNGLPHSVEMPEGSSVAKSRSGQAGTDIRRTEPDQFANDKDLALESHHIVLQASANDALSAANLPRHDQIERADPTLGSATAASAQATVAPVTAPDASKPIYDTPMADMNFPARLIQLKIDNDTVRAQLQALELLMLDNE